MSDHHKDIDEATGIATTGHSWDGIKELDNPLPRWWLYLFYATIAFAVVYWVLMPAWPLLNGYTPGLRGHSDRAIAAQEVAANKARHTPFFDRLTATALPAAQTDPELSTFAMAAGQALFANNCATCHGAGGQGAVGGFPNLGDENWIWTGTVDGIAQTIRHGIRNDDEASRGAFGSASMPAFGATGVLDRAQIADTTEYVVSLANGPANAAAAARGAAHFAANCVSCHGTAGRGDPSKGAPNLTDAEWLMAGPQASRAGDWDAIRASITRQLNNPLLGAMPAWGQRLGEGEVRALALYVHSLGGGQATPPPPPDPASTPAVAPAAVPGANPAR